MRTETIISASLLDELQHRLANAANGIRDAEEMKKACEHMDWTREELRLRIGTVNVAVELIRDAAEREQCPVVTADQRMLTLFPSDVVSLATL